VNQADLRSCLNRTIDVSPGLMGTGYWVLGISYGLRVAGCELRVTGYELLKR